MSQTKERCDRQISWSNWKQKSKLQFISQVKVGMITPTCTKPFLREKGNNVWENWRDCPTKVFDSIKRYGKLNLNKGLNSITRGNVQENRILILSPYKHNLNVKPQVPNTTSLIVLVSKIYANTRFSNFFFSFHPNI